MDANVFVSAAGWSGAPPRIAQRWLEHGDFEIVACPRLLAEVRDVLAGRPRLRATRSRHRHRLRGELGHHARLGGRSGPLHRPAMDPRHRRQLSRGDLTGARRTLPGSPTDWLLVRSICPRHAPLALRGVRSGQEARATRRTSASRASAIRCRVRAVGLDAPRSIRLMSA